MIDPVSRILHRNAGIHGPVMLMYHSIRPGKITPDWPWAVSMQRFRSHLDFLVEQGWSTPTMAELITAPERCSDRTLVITFDDGYMDNLSACEELHKRGMRATWFVVSGSIGQEPSWPSDGRPDGRLLNAAELCSMQTAGMEIGSHTVNHARLTDLDEECQRAELIESKAAIEDMLGNSISSFAFPYGAWNKHSLQEVRAAGYRAACTTRTGWALRDADPYQLRRLTIFNTDSTSTLARKLYFGSHDVSWFNTSIHAMNLLAGRIKQ